MSRLGYICDGCDDEYERRGPAAVVRDDEKNWLDLCSECYDGWDEEEKEVVEA